MARLVSVNIGLPQEIEWQGTRIRTGIIKSPVTSRVRARRLNLDGDGQADLNGHGGEQRAILVYQTESYRYWQQVLKRSDLYWGLFGENFTVEGLPDAQVCIGDRYRIGEALFEVSQPRVTCFRVGLRLGNPAMPAMMVAQGRPGFYLRVLEEGEVGAGDVIEKVADGPGRMSVAEVDALLYLGKHPVEALRRALNIPALSPGWQGSMRALLEAALQGQHSGNAGLSLNATSPAWSGFRPLTVASIQRDTPDVVVIELEATDATELPQGLPGQHVVLRLTNTGQPNAVLRTYSLCGSRTSRTYRIGVKQERGPGSLFLHDHLRVGDRIESSAPRGTFTLTPGPDPIVLLSAGIGVTPMLSMLNEAAARPERWGRALWWIHSARNGQQHAFAAESRRLLSQVTGAQSLILYSQPQATDRLGRDYDHAGRLSLDLLRELNIPEEADYFLCGPAPYLETIRGFLGDQGLGIAPARIHVELFGSDVAGSTRNITAAPHPPAGVAGAGPQVSFIRSQLSVRWDDRFGSLLELAEACSVPCRWSCRSGVCHRCESGLIDGTVRYSPDPLDNPPAGQILICCSRPDSDLELDL